MNTEQQNYLAALHKLVSLHDKIESFYSMTHLLNFSEQEDMAHVMDDLLNAWDEARAMSVAWRNAS